MLKVKRKTLLEELNRAADGDGLLASLCAEAADRIARQDARIIKLKRECARRRRKNQQAALDKP